MKSKKRLLTCLLLAAFMIAVGVTVTLFASGCGEPTEIAKPTVAATSFVYNGAEQGITIEANDNYTVSGDQKKTDVGTYTVTVALKDKEKTAWKGGDSSDLTFTYTITQADNAFTTEYATADYTYGATPTTTAAVAKFGTPTVKYYSNAACTSEIAGMTKFDAATAVGTYYVKVAVTGTDNYKELSKVYTVVVDKIAVAKPTVETTTFTYNGEAQGIEIAVSDNYTVTGDQKSTDAGEYNVTVSLKDKTNYKWADGDSEDLTFTFTIAKADNAYTTEYATADYTYGAAPTTTAAVAKFGTPTVKYYSDEACEAEITNMTGFTAETNAGAYYVKVTVDGTDNYTALSEVYTVVVAQAEVTKPTATENAFVFDGAEHNIVVPENDLYTVTSDAKTEKGAYSATVSLKDPTNYKWKGGDSADITLGWTISAVENAWTTEYNVPDYVFGGTPSVTDAAVKFGDVKTEYYYDADCTEPVEGMTGFDSATPAGTYYVKVSVAGTESYGGLNGVYKVVVAQCEVERPAVGATEFTYNGNAQGIEIADSDKYTVTGDMKKTDAGTYTVTVALNDKANYKWADGDSEDLTFTFTIAKAIAERPAVGDKLFAYNNKEQTVFTAPEDALYTVSGNKATAVGNYTVTFKLNDKDNYTWEGGSVEDIEIDWEITRGTATVSDESELNAAIADEGYDAIKLSDDVVTTSAVILDRNMTLDLNGYTATATAGKPIFAIVAGNVVIENGSLACTSLNPNSDVPRLVEVREAATKLTMNGVTAKSTGFGIGIFTDAYLELNDCDIEVAWQVIATNNGMGSATVSVNGGSLTSTDDAAIYMSCYTDITLTNVAVTGKTAIDFRVGKLTIAGGSLTSTTAHKKMAYGDVTYANGTYEAGEGSALHVRANFYYDNNIKTNSAEISVSDSTIINGVLSVYDLHNAKNMLPNDAIDQIAALKDFIDGFNGEKHLYEIGAYNTVIEVASFGKSAFVSTDAELRAAINAGFGYIKVTSDFTATKLKASDTTVFEVNSLAAPVDLIIDLNGHTITADVPADNKTEKLFLITANDSGNNSTGNKLKFTLSNGTLDGGNAWYAMAFGSKQNDILDITLSNVVFKSHDGGISSNGLDYGAAIRADHCDFISTVESKDALGAYFPGNHRYDFIDCKFTGGLYGVEIRSGSHSYTDCVFSGKSDAMLVASATSYKTDNTAVSISGGTFKSSDGYGIHEKTVSGTPYFDVTFDGNVTFEATQGGVLSENNRVTAEAGSAAEFKNFFNAGVEKIKLTGDFVADITIPEGRTLTLDLNGHKLTNVSNHTIVNNGTLTVTDTSADKAGVIDNVTHGKAAVWNEVGATFTLEAGTLTRSMENGQSATVSGGNSYYVLLNHGRAYLNGGAITQNGHYSSLIENGWQKGSQNTEGGNSVMVISGGMFSGGLNTVKNDDYGDLTISGGTFANNSQAAVLNWNIAAISGGEFTVSDGAQAVILNGKHDDVMDKGQLTVTGGTFTGADIFARHSTATYGGTITVNSEALRDAALKITDATVVFEHEGHKTAYVGDEAALAEFARGGGIDIVLTDDIMLTSTVEIRSENTVIIDLNGHIVTVTQTDGRSLYAIDNYGTLTLKDSSADEAGKIVARGVQNKSGGKMYMLSGTIESCDSNGGGAAIWNEGDLEMTGGTLAFTGEPFDNDSGVPLNVREGSTAAITGGELISDYSCIFSAGDLTVTGLTLANKTGYWHCIKIFDGKTVLTNVTVNSTYGGGMEVAGGKADVYNCSFTQKEYYDWNSTLMAVSNMGVLNIDGGSYSTFNSTGTSENYGLYIFTSGGTINIYNGDFSADKNVLRVDNTTYENTKGVINVYGGNFTGAVEIGNDPAKASMTVSGGTFSVDVGKYCADGKACENISEGVYEIVDVNDITAKIVKAIASVSGNGDKQFNYETTDDDGNPLTKNYSYTLIEFDDVTITEEVRDELLHLDLFDPDLRNVVVTVGTGSDKWYIITGDYNFTDDYLFGEGLFYGHNTVINNFPFE